MSVPPVEPPATIGMIGGGQLGQFALVAARSMGFSTMLLEPDPDAPAGRIADVHLVADYDDPTAVRQLGDECDVVTVEFENPPAATLERLASVTRVAPSPAAVGVAQDRRAEKRFLVEHGVPVGPFQVLEGHDPGVDVDRPSIVKTARLGYDGKGQLAVGSNVELHAAWAELGGVPCVVEERLELDVELSVVLARSHDGGIASFDVAENRHVDGILDVTVVPARVSALLADRATGLAATVADALDYVGVLAVEMFVVGGEVLVNEIAPRPHNSGHWTLDAARTSQFDQQVRAVCGLPLGDPGRSAPAAAMVNLLGDLWDRGEPNWSAALDDPHISLHLYRKTEPRVGRKMGHLTATAADAGEAEVRAIAARERLTPE